MIRGALFMVVLVGCSEKATAPAHNRQTLSFSVDVLSVEAKRVDYLVQSPGTIDAFERVQVTARVAGAVDHVLFAEGQAVKKGATLVSIDGERYGLAVAQARAALQKAEATQADAEAQVARRVGATKDHPGLIPGEELGEEQTKELTAKADTEVALQALKTAQVNLRDSSVTAPMDGIIQTRTVETGQYLQPGYVMATLLRNDPMLLHFQVEPDDAPRLKPGMSASFTLRETQRTFTATLTLVAGAADSATHMVQVTGEVDDKQHKYWLRPGSFCDVTIDLGAKRDSPVIHGAEALSDGANVHATRVTPESLGGAADGGTAP
jgi:RND family efflux transporter MFP subunit